MIVYEPHKRIPDSDFTDLGDPAALGGRVLEGNPRIAARIDFQQGNLTAGVFEGTTGKVEITDEGAAGASTVPWRHCSGASMTHLPPQPRES